MTIRQYSLTALMLMLCTVSQVAEVAAQRKAIKAAAPAVIEKPKISSNAIIGDQFAANGEFALAADYYQRALRARSGDMYAQYRLAEAYESMLDYPRAEAGFQRVVQSRAKGFPMAQFRWPVMLKINGKYDLAKREFEVFVNTFVKSSEDEQVYVDRAKMELAGCELAIKEMTTRQPEYQLQVLPAPVNTFQSEYAPALGDNDSTILITSNRPESRGNQKDPVLGGRFSDFFQFSKVGSDWQRSYPSTTFDKINSKLSEGAGTYTADKLRYYYTSCANEDQCQIFMTQSINSKWTEPVVLNSNINMSGYSSKQPSLSPKGDTMFFVSNRPGGLGGNDVYYAINRGNDNWDIPVNLGAAINTPFNDMSPCYYAPEHMLFFASNGREGFGGLDIFCATGRDFDKAVNIGLPFNSNRDDFYFVQGSKYGFMTSNRENGVGKDDIYSFLPFYVAPTLRQAILEKDKLNRPVVAVTQETPKSIDKTGEVVAKDDKKPVEGEEVELTDEKGNKLKTTKTDKDGKFAFNNLPDNKKYKVKKGNKGGKNGKGNKADGSDSENNGSDSENNGTDSKNNSSDSETVIKNVKEKLVAKPSTRFLYENVYFDFDKSDLRPEATKVLDDLIAYSKENEGIQIEMISYTDNIGTPDYNKALASRRAAAAQTYLEANGMQATKLVQKARGETNFLANNGSPTGRQLNRRCEFYVLGGTKVKGSQVFITNVSTSVEDIAKRYGMTAAELRSLNNITGDEVNPYQPIRVKRVGNGAVTTATMNLSKKSNDELPERKAEKK